MVPQLLAMLSVVAVFIPSFFMVGITRELFIPLSLAVGFAMIASTILASTLVPIMSAWLLDAHAEKHDSKPDFLDLMKTRLNDFVKMLLPVRYVVVGLYFAS